MVDAASYVSGPFAASTLADLGADVVKVEPPRGDPYRRFGPRHGDSSLLFRAANQNKRSVALDLKTDTGRAAFHRLLTDADVLITNWRPEASARIGLDPESVRADFPQLIWVRITGFGPDGPMGELPAFDSVIQARSGVMLSGSDSPVTANNIVADKVTAMAATQTALAALFERTTSGQGSVCDLAMIDALAHFYGADVTAGHRIPGEQPDQFVAEAMFRDTTLRTADSWILVVPVSGAQLRRALEATGVGDAWEEIRAGGPDDIWPRFVARVASTIATKTTAEWESIFAEHDVPATAVLDFETHIADPQVAHNETYEVVDDPELGPYLRPRFPARFDGWTVTTAGRPAPTLPPSENE